MTNPLRVAVAEDEPMNQRRLLRLLQECGCEVVATFGNGLEVEEWLGTNPEVDALFLDIQMPGLDGMSLRASIDPDLPVVFVTAYAEHAVEAFSLDAVDFLLKPVTTDRLVKSLAKIRRALGQRRDGGRSAPVTRYPVNAGTGVVFMELSRTAYFEVEEQVVWAFAGERFRTKWKTLGEVEAFFPDAGLLRIHRHLLIRPEAVLGIRSSGGGSRVMVRMIGGVELEASRGATPKLKAALRIE
ncbi:LytR/AlgR family response regulator transcription factor [Holophaga foetida]|uniref:LytR/AlgR family response regulator transcription factor n=1 Tax=Holophaga foetida TaxID=35839 RepID=UPI0002474291|nr:LytTR family DNA-binding domain-containing protein [Holophaga foetida]